MHTTITPVTRVVTKKGSCVNVECNEEKELCLSDPLLSDALRSEWPEEKLKAGVSKDMKSIKDYQV